jgi:hypothetical protein
MSIATPNMMQQQNYLSSMSPQEWARFVNNPSPQVDSLIISMESQRRIKEAQKNQLANAQVPTGTVADKVNAQAAQLANPTPMGIGTIPNTQMAQAPQMSQGPIQPPVQMASGGLAGLDTGNMYNENSFAAGGIVAFDDGGYVLPSDYDPEAYQQALQDKLAAEEERYGSLPSTTGESALSRGIKKLPRYFEHEKNIQNIKRNSPSPYGPALDYYKGQLKLPGANRGAIQEAMDSLQNEKIKGLNNKSAMQQDQAGFKQNEIDRTALKPPLEEKKPIVKSKGQPSTNDLLKDANAKYTDSLDKTTAAQTSNYDAALKRLMDIYNQEDPARAEMKAKLDKDKSNAIYDVLGDVGKGLSKAVKGKEFEAAGEGFGLAQTRMADLKKEGKALDLDTMKAKRELSIIGAKYGFESEQFKDKLNATKDIEKAKINKDIQVANIMAGSKDKTFDAAQNVKQDTYFKDWLKGEGAIHAPFLSADENAKGISDKLKQSIINAKKAATAKKAEASTRFPATGNYAYGQAGFAGFNPSLYQVTPADE